MPFEKAFIQKVFAEVRVAEGTKQIKKITMKMMGIKLQAIKTQALGSGAKKTLAAPLKPKGQIFRPNRVPSGNFQH